MHPLMLAFFLITCVCLFVDLSLLLHIKTFGADDTLWTGGPGNYTNPKAPTVLSKVRNLVDKGQYAEATAVAYDLSGDQTQVHVVF